MTSGLPNAASETLATTSLIPNACAPPCRNMVLIALLPCRDRRCYDWAPSQFAFSQAATLPSLDPFERFRMILPGRFNRKCADEGIQLLFEKLRYPRAHWVERFLRQYK